MRGVIGLHSTILKIGAPPVFYNENRFLTMLDTPQLRSVLVTQNHFVWICYIPLSHTVPRVNGQTSTNTLKRYTTIDT